MANQAEKGLIVRGLLMRDLVVRGITDRSLIEKGNIERSPSTMSLITTTVMRRWKIQRKSTLLSSVKWRGRLKVNSMGDAR
jgi:hypothetical protein